MYTVYNINLSRVFRLFRTPAFLIDLNRPVMFGQGSGEVVGSVILGYKIEVIGFCRIENGLNGFQARIPYGTGGQSLKDVGIVRGWCFQIFSCQISIESIHTIDNGWITSQRHVTP